MEEDKIFEMIIDEEQHLDGVFAISLVSVPAIHENFVALKEEEIALASVDDEKKLVMGAVLVPNRKILRKDADGNPFHIYFTEKTVRKASEIYLSKGRQNNATLEHEFNIDGMSVVESWIVEDEDKDKSRVYNLSVPKGTWMVTMKAENDVVWEEFVKTGIVKGFSIEGRFDHLLKMSDAEEVEAQRILKELRELLID